MASKTEKSVVSGPGKWEISQALAQILEPSTVVSHVQFSFGDSEKSWRGGKITGIRQEREFTRRSGYIEIEGYLFNGVSPYEDHGSPFIGTYNPTTRRGLLTIREK